MDALSVDLDDLQADEASEGLEGTGESHARTDVGSEHLVGIEMAVAVPAGPVPAGRALGTLVTAGNQWVVDQPQPQSHSTEHRAFTEEGKVEAPSVPGDQDSGFQTGQMLVEVGQRVGFCAVEHCGGVLTDQRNSEHRCDLGIKAVGSGVGLDVEPVERQVSVR